MSRFVASPEVVAPGRILRWNATQGVGAWGNAEMLGTGRYYGGACRHVDPGDSSTILLPSALWREQRPYLVSLDVACSTDAYAAYGATLNTGGQWRRVSWPIRAPAWYQSAFSVQLWAAGATDLRWSRLNVDWMAPRHHAEWADHALRAMGAAMPAYTEAGRFARMQRTMAILAGRGTLKVLHLGDSISGNAGNSAVASLIERAYPGARVLWYNAALSGATAATWAAADKSSLYALAPDLFIFGTYSDPCTHDGPWYDLQAQVTAGFPATTEQLWCSKLLHGTGATGDFVRAIASSRSVGFYDADKAYSDWCDAGGEIQTYDGLHCNETGRHMLGWGFASFFGARAS